MKKEIITLLLLLVVVCSGIGYAAKGKESTKIQGLENAMLMVKDETQTQHLEQVMNRMQEQHRERLNGLEGLVIEENDVGDVIATGKRKAKLFWGLMSVQRKLKYNVDSEGNIERVRRWHEFMWKKFSEEA